MGLRRREIREFRASWLIRVPVLLAFFLWLGVGTMAAFVEGMPSYVFVSIGFFVLFFLIFIAYYFNMAYVVHEYGVTVRGATDFEHFDWEDILTVHGTGVPLGGYYVVTTRGGFVLSSFIKGHEILVDLIVARAGLMPMRAAGS